MFGRNCLLLHSNSLAKHFGGPQLRVDRRVQVKGEMSLDNDVDTLLFGTSRQVLRFASEKLIVRRLLIIFQACVCVCTVGSFLSRERISGGTDTPAVGTGHQKRERENKEPCTLSPENNIHG